MRKITPVLAAFFALVIFAGSVHADMKTDCGEARTIKQRIAACTKLIESDKFGDDVHAGAYLLRGISYIGTGQNDLAIRDFTSIISYGPDHVPSFYRSALVKRAWAYLQKQMFDEAITDLDRVIALNPNEYEAHRNRAFAYGKKRQFDKAIEDATSAIKNEPDDGNSYAIRGALYQQTGQKDAAIRDYRRALSLNPYPEVVEAVRLGLEELGAKP